MLTDISYLQYGDSKTAYLSTILDASTNEVLSFQVKENMKLELVMETLSQLKDKRFINFGNSMIHSDQGWHYRHKQYVQMLQEKGIRQSMSRKGNCYDNSVMENFFGHLKSELLYLEEFESMEHFKAELIEYIDYYNNRRIKARLKGLPPALHRQQALSAA